MGAEDYGFEAGGTYFVYGCGDCAIREAGVEGTLPRGILTETLRRMLVSALDTDRGHEDDSLAEGKKQFSEPTLRKEHCQRILLRHRKAADLPHVEGQLAEREASVFIFYFVDVYCTFDGMRSQLYSTQAG